MSRSHHRRNRVACFASDSYGLRDIDRHQAPAGHDLPFTWGCFPDAPLGTRQRVNRGHALMAGAGKKSETFLLGVSIPMVFLRRLNGSMRLASAFSQH